RQARKNRWKTVRALSRSKRSRSPASSSGRIGRMRKVAPQSTRTVRISSRGYPGGSVAGATRRAGMAHPPGPFDAERGNRDSPGMLRVPLVNLFAGGQPHPLLLPHVVVHRLEVLDPVRDAGNIRMHGQRHDAWIPGSLRVEPIEVVFAALLPLRRLVMLD